MPRNPAITSYNHDQITASDTWIINHKLGFKPVPSVNVDYEGVRQAILPADIQHVDDNTIKIIFSQPFTGSARFV